MIPYSFHPEAEAEFAAAASFYESRVAGLGRSFSAEVHRTISLIREYPDAGALVRPSVRKALVDRFPYVVVYRHGPESVIILVIAHARHRPGYWQRRKSRPNPTVNRTRRYAASCSTTSARCAGYLPR